MRTIKFRGKSILTDEWFYGDLVHSADKKRTAILVNDKDSYDECEVDPETVGQFTGLYDCDGKEIYEGDKLYVNSSNKIFTGVVTWDKNESYYKLLDFGNTKDIHQTPLFRWINIDIILEIVGNIHDNTELLKGGEE